MIISFFEINEFEKNKYDTLLKGHTLKFFKEKIQDVPSALYEDSEIISVFINSSLDEQTTSICKNLKMVCTRSTGINHIDTKYFESKKIKVKNVPLYGENTVAEHTFALMLSLSRKIEESSLALDSHMPNDLLTGFDLKGKTIGIIGGGRIGLHVARMARSFGIHVRVYDIHEDNFLAELINFKYLTFDELIKSADIISLHVPLTSKTFHMINLDTISNMKDGVIIINTARGELINTKDLISGLKSKKIYGAGLDVLENEECLFTNNYSNCSKDVIDNFNTLKNLPNVVITPHNAYNSKEAIERIIQKTTDNILNL